MDKPWIAGALAGLCACAGQSVPLTTPLVPEAADGQGDHSHGTSLRRVMRISAVNGDHHRPLFEGIGQLASRYPVAIRDDVVISFDEALDELRGQISVRARILGPTPIEIPVENYTVVNDKELKEERKLLLADDTDFFRDGPHRQLVTRVTELQRLAREYRMFLEETAVSAMESLYGEADVQAWYNAQDLPGRFTRSSNPTTVTAAIASIRRALADDGERVKVLRAGLSALQDDINTLFLQSEQALQLGATDLAIVQARAMDAVGGLSDLRSGLDTSLATDLVTLDACAPRFTGYETRKATEARRPDGTTVTLAAGTYVRVDGSTPRRILFPPDLEGLTVDVAGLAEVKLPDEDCYARVLPGVVNRLGRQLAAAQETVKSLRPVEDSPTAVLILIEKMKTVIRDGIQRRLSQDVRDARVRLSTLSLSHGDRLEIIVRISRPATLLKAGDSPGTVDIEERVVIRAVDHGWSFSTRPQFVLVKRASDVRTATATDKPANFAPAVGAVFNIRYRTLARWSDWVIPSAGISAHAVDFDPSAESPIEIGLGPSLGLLNDHINVGVGWNLSVHDDRRYWWVSLDFLKATDTFSGLWGGGT